MKQAIVTRLARLEDRDTPSSALVIVRQIVRPDGKIIRPECLKSSDGRVWWRESDEAPEAFQARAIEEARQGAQGRPVSLRPDFETRGE